LKFEGVKLKKLINKMGGVGELNSNKHGGLGASTPECEEDKI
jgi:hypothetical protein